MGVAQLMPQAKFCAGDVVIVRRGKHVGLRFVVVDTDGDRRVLIADGINHKADKPKKKNILHIQKTLIRLEDVAGRVAGGKPLDNGWLRQKITDVFSNNGNTSCDREVEATVWPKKK